MVHTREGKKGSPPFEKGGIRGILKIINTFAIVHF
jgi:hypothetical protein